MNINDLLLFPTTYLNNRGENHESLLRSYQLVQHIKTMLARGDSQKSILELIEFVESSSQQPATPNAPVNSLQAQQSPNPLPLHQTPQSYH